MNNIVLCSILVLTVFPVCYISREEVLNLIADRYRIISTLSIHPHSCVWLAEHTGLGEKRIIKGIPRGAAGYGRLVSEARLMNNLSYPNIPIIYDVEEDDEFTYIIEQYIEGESLGVLCTHRLLSEKEIFNFIIRISTIIKYLHSLPERIFYLDIKPDNIVVSDGDVWLVDFGSAVKSGDLQDAAYAGSGKYQDAAYASKGWCAPEQLAGIPVNATADIYALGGLLEFMLEHGSVSSAAGEKLRRIAARCKSRRPWDRIASADILIRMLEKASGRDIGRKKKKVGTDRLQGKKIGVMGLGPGVGTTTVAISLANYLSDVEYKSVVLAEESNHCDFMQLPKLGTGKPSRGKPVKQNGVTYLPGDMEGREQYLMKNRFDCTVLDLGGSSRRSLELLGLCDIRIVVAGAAYWRRGELDFLKRLKDTASELTGWLLFLSPAEERLLLKLEDYGLPVFAFPPEFNVLYPGKETINVFERALK